MDRHLLSARESWFHRWFPERQIIVRSRGQVQYASFSPRLQAGIAAGFVAVMVWAVATTIDWGYGRAVLLIREREYANSVSEKERTIAELLAAYEQISGELEGARSRVGGLSREIDDRLERIRTLASQYGRLRDIYSVTRAELDNVIRDRDQAVASREEMAGRIDGLEQRIQVMTRDHKESLDRLVNRAMTSIGSLEKTIKLTGLNPQDLLQQVADQQAGGQGGPFIALSKVKTKAEIQPETAEQTMARLENSLARWGGLQALLARMPLGKPTDLLSLSSGYGRRMDPFTRTYAFHSGIDFQGQPGTAVMATAPGVVSYVGRKGPYGLTVEIDHSYGFKTRYGHLKLTSVDVGDVITIRQPIGGMGSTGRSTGTHLHYEVLFNDETFDPANFIEAGNHVLKLQEAEASPRRK